jgi:hypothetical protein
VRATDPRPDRPRRPARTGRPRDAGRPDRAADPLAVRVAAGVLISLFSVGLALVEAFLVPLRVGTVPLPICVLLGVAGNVVLTKLAVRQTGSVVVGVLQPVLWLLVIVVLSLPRAEGDLIVPARRPAWCSCSPARSPARTASRPRSPVGQGRPPVPGGSVGRDGHRAASRPGPAARLPRRDGPVPDRGHPGQRPRAGRRGPGDHGEQCHLRVARPAAAARLRRVRLPASTTWCCPPAGSRSPCSAWTASRSPASSPSAATTPRARWPACRTTAARTPARCCLDEALATFECVTTAAHPGGDHTVLIGEVLAVEMPRPEAEPLVWHRARYTALASPPDGRRRTPLT